MSETIYYNGSIIPMEEGARPEAIAVENGTITKVGSREELFASKKADAVLFDLEGKTLLPAFIDPHSHITALANSLSLVSLADTASFDDIVKKLREHKEKMGLAPGRWIVGFGYDHNFLAEKAHPNRQVLDQVSTENPVLISHTSGHMGVMNTAALMVNHVTDETPDPSGGKIIRDSAGHATGYMEENAFLQYSASAGQAAPEELDRLMLEAEKVYLRYGITTVQDGMVKGGNLPMLERIAKGPGFTVDVIGYVDLKDHQGLLEEHPEYVEASTGNFRFGGYKLFLDGSPQGRTAWLTKPYLGDEADYCGYPIYEDGQVTELLKTAISEGRQVLTHCNGDAAGDQLIRCYSKALEETGSTAYLRPVMIHAQTARPDQVDRMKMIGMMPSYFVAHVYYWGDIHLENLGKERAEAISPAHTTVEKGVPFTFHQDTPVVPCDMLHTIWCAVNRLTKAGRVLGEKERITPYEALRAVTINAAYQYFEEDRKGSIRVGKDADLVILDRDPLAVDPMEIKDIQVLETIKRGTSVYKK